MSDERLEDRLMDAADQYHRPGSVPREEMWARIEEARRARRVVPLQPRMRPRWVLGVAALAAALLIGVLIGRSSMWMDGGRVSAPSPIAGPATSAAKPTAEPHATPPGTSEPGAQLADARPDPERAAAATGRREAGAPGTARPATPVPQSEGTPRNLLPYQLAAVQHMSRVDALLTTVRAEARRAGADSGQAAGREAGRMDAALEPWARELLSNTRLLLDSPAASDPRLRALLSDLELVLAQIVQLPAQRRGEELQLLDRTLEDGDVITKLRTAIPSGMPSA